MKKISVGRALSSFFINSFLSIYCYRNIKIYLGNHLNVGIWTLYKKKTIFPHPLGIVIGYKVQIGEGCKIYHNVTIGTKETQNFKEGRYPTIGDNVIIYPNSIIIGDIKIGNNAVIGAGSIVLEDVPPNTIVSGSPARVIKSNSLED